MKPLHLASIVTAIMVACTPQAPPPQSAPQESQQPSPLENSGQAAESSRMAGGGNNIPTVQSAFGGSYYARSIPSEDSGTKGKTQVFKVESSGDELLDEYPVYMRGELYLGWSPMSGKWSLVHLEPARVSSDIDVDNMGKVTRLAFYSGGKEVFSYSSEDLRKLGLERRVAHLKNNLNGSFTVHGIEQIPLANDYVFVMERTVDNSSNTEKILLDITTGKIFIDESRKKQ